MTNSHPATLAAARRALAEAVGASAPIDADLAERMQARMTPEAWDAMQAEVAAIATTIPALTAEVAALEAKSCPRCSGTGDWHGPTNHVRHGRPICFDCGGTGVRTR